MHLLPMNVIIWALMVIAAAQPSCDPLTQYEDKGQCCTMCPPGTSMTSLGSCLDPDCKECDENQYTDKYTKERHCERQPYCDANRNFQITVHKSKKEKTICQCQQGFHCSSESCITCVPHTKCGPGHGAVTKGRHERDTVCQKCPEGTFSNETSWYGVCKKWTECESGYHIQKAGSDTYDSICEPSRHHVVVAIAVVVPLIILVLVILGVCWYMYRGKSGNLKVCVEACRGERQKQPIEGAVLLTQPTVHGEEESTFHEGLPSQEEGSRGTPEENEDEASQEMSSDVALTENGNFVTQEDGKKEVLSRQESQTQTFID